MAPATATAVQIVDFSFVPSHVTVRKGESVTWTHANPLAQLHTINSEDGAVESPHLYFGQQFSQAFPTPGTYRCYCHVHSFMSTVITVVDVPILTERARDTRDEPAHLSKTAIHDTHRMSTYDAFVHAASLNQTSVVQRWIDKGHDIDHEDTDGHRALCVAAQNQCMDTMALLVAHGANIHVKQTGGQTPLHTACTWGKRQAVEMLLRLGAEVDVKDDNGQVPLHCACQHGDPALVSLLLNAMADPYLEDEHHRIPRDIASDWKRLDALRELEAYCTSTYRHHMHGLFDVALAGRQQEIPSGVETAIFDFLA